MSGAECAVGAAISSELRSAFAGISVILSWLLIACLGGWLILGCIGALKALSMKRFGISLAILVILLTSQLALAQPMHQVGKSKAQFWSVGATLAPVVVGSGLLYISHVEGSDDLGTAGSLVASSGLVFGPGVGHACAKQWGQTVKGTIIRAAGAGLFLWGVTTLEIEIDIWGTKDESSSGGGTPSELFIVAGGLMVVMSAAHDLMTVSKSVDEYNHSQGLSNVRVTPTYFANHKAPGVILTLSF